MDSKPVRLIARVVALQTNKRFLSAVNSLVSFQVARCVASVAALFAIVTFLSIMLKLVHFELAGHFEIYFFWRVRYLTMLWDD